MSYLADSWISFSRALSCYTIFSPIHFSHHCSVFMIRITQIMVIPCLKSENEIKLVNFSFLFYLDSVNDNQRKLVTYKDETMVIQNYTETLESIKNNVAVQSEDKKLYKVYWFLTKHNTTNVFFLGHPF